ncbi:MAG TPA: hypothetical protein VFN26_18695 [Candidatus Acidoferrum sp.]|nr:hypothetical protein [Candidatus Acidoferrum sp.]
MRHPKTFLIVVGTITLLLAGKMTARAQEQGEDGKPKPAAHTYFPALLGYQDPSGDQDSAPALQPDVRPLTGIQNPTLGTPEFRHSYWVPGFQYSDIVSSNSLNQTTNSGWNSTSYLVGNLSLYEAWSRSRLSVNYSGGGFFPSDSSQSRGYFHQFGLDQNFDWGRWQLALLDQFFYLPDSPFGFGGGTGISIPGVGGSLGAPLPGLGGSYQPNQTILTSFGARYGNSFAPQVSYTISRRSSINIAGSYGILRFVQAGNIQSNDYGANAGYNYSLGKKDTLGVLYRFNAFRYIGIPQGLNDHAVQLSYGRKITGRLALQLSGGPEFTMFAVPMGNASNQIGASASVGLNYGTARNFMTLTYTHGVSNGSGVQVGSSSDQLQTGLARQLSRTWKGNFNFGYARNGSLGSPGMSQTPQSFNSFYVGGNLSHPLGREATFSIAYTARIQISNQAICAGGVCNTNHTENQITLGFSWHTRPFVLH